MSSRSSSQQHQNQASKIPTRHTASAGQRVKAHSEASTSSISSANGRTFSKTVGAKELKENILPLAPIRKPQDQKPTRKPTKSFTELTRQNKELLSTVEDLYKVAEKKESEHVEVVDRLTQEIQQLKDVQSTLRHEIAGYKNVLQERCKELAALRLSVEELKFENERITFILEGARIDKVSGARIDRSSQLVSQRQFMDMEFEGHNKELDVFLSELESTIARLKSSSLDCREGYHDCTEPV